MARYRLSVFYLLFPVALLLTEPALAGPGGKIARAAFETPMGKVALCLLILFWLPILIKNKIKAVRAERRTRQDLSYLSTIHSSFDWLFIKDRAVKCFHEVHNAWSKEDLAGAQEYMAEDFREDQQSQYLDKWKMQ